MAPPKVTYTIRLDSEKFVYADGDPDSEIYIEKIPNGGTHDLMARKMSELTDIDVSHLEFSAFSDDEEGYDSDEAHTRDFIRLKMVDVRKGKNRVINVNVTLGDEEYVVRLNQQDTVYDLKVELDDNFPVKFSEVREIRYWSGKFEMDDEDKSLEFYGVCDEESYVDAVAYKTVEQEEEDEEDEEEEESSKPYYMGEDGNTYCRDDEGEEDEDDDDEE